MKITVLGKYGPYPAAGGACSGYFVQDGDTKVLLDCGNGILSRLQQMCVLTELDAIVISHLHSDHFCDLLVLKYAMDIMAARSLRQDVPLPVYLPSSPFEDFSRIAYKNAFELRPIDLLSEVRIKTLDLRFAEMTHPVLSYAISVSNGQKRLVYSGDTSYNDDLIDFARGSDLLLADAGLLEKDKKGAVNHMTAAEVGKVASEANVSKLLQSHIWPLYDEKELIEECKAYYPNPTVAQEMKTYDI
jgi:ribonuclease BN (tRNA processing enzyme)